MTHSMPFPLGGWIFDRRGAGRGVRVSAHTEAGFLVLSTWKSDVCVGTVRLLPDEASQLVSTITDGLARLATANGAAATDVAGPVEVEQDRRLAALEARLDALGIGPQRT
jgi:hypothetical protein